MARKKSREEHENHDRWLVSYADFITLLFAFFVVMYSISSVNEGKYRILSDAMVTAFRDPARSLDPVQVGTLMRAPVQSDKAFAPHKPVIDLFKMPFADKPVESRHEEKHPSRYEESGKDAHLPGQRPRSLAESITAAMASLIAKGLIEVRRDKRWVEVEIKSSVLFDSGTAELSRQSLPVLRALAKTLKPLHNSIHVEGFTDNVPISTFEFRSNWELSAARAASVVHLFTRLGVDPQRMAAIGYGQFRPVASNDTPEGRAKNRRVVLVIMSGTDARVSEHLNDLQTHREAPLSAAGVEKPASPPPVKGGQAARADTSAPAGRTAAALFLGPEPEPVTKTGPTRKMSQATTGPRKAVSIAGGGRATP